MIVFRCSLKVYQYFLKTPRFWATACSCLWSCSYHLAMTVLRLQTWSSHSFGLDHMMHHCAFNTCISVVYLGLLQCSPVIMNWSMPTGQVRFWTVKNPIMHPLPLFGPKGPPPVKKGVYLIPVKKGVGRPKKPREPQSDSVVEALAILKKKKAGKSCCTTGCCTTQVRQDSIHSSEIDCYWQSH